MARSHGSVGIRLFALHEEANQDASGHVLDGLDAPEVEGSSSSATSRTQPSGIFCYALVRTPLESTTPLLAKQLAAACDAWALFSTEDTPEYGVKTAYSKTD